MRPAKRSKPSPRYGGGKAVRVKAVDDLAEWRECGGGDLEPALMSGGDREPAVALIDARWIIKYAESKGAVIKHRQALPNEAFLSRDALAKAMVGEYSFPVAALSHMYMWLTKEHPDPDGANLQRVARALRALIDGGRLQYGVFWDYLSLHQHPGPANGVMRTEEENALFKQGLGYLSTLYSHQNTWVLRLTSFPDGHNKEDQPEGANMAEYIDRGWCFTENALASLTKESRKSLDLGLMEENKVYDRDALIADCTKGGGRLPPLLPSQFAAELEMKSFTNGTDDKPRVKGLYEAAFKEQFCKADWLKYRDLKWGDEEAAQLAKVLASGEAPQLKELWLDSNQIGDEGLEALAVALGKGGAAPSLKATLGDSHPSRPATVISTHPFRTFRCSMWTASRAS